MPASLPFIEPCIPREVRQPPKGEGWLHEPKLDGWRCQAVKMGAKVTLYSRHGHDLTKRFPTVAAAVAKLPAKTAVIDGEIVQFRASGIDFYGLMGIRMPFRNGRTVRSRMGLPSCCCICWWSGPSLSKSWRRGWRSLRGARDRPVQYWL